MTYDRRYEHTLKEALEAAIQNMLEKVAAQGKEWAKRELWKQEKHGNEEAV